MTPNPYIEFVDMTPPDRLTRIVDVRSVRTGSTLGTIRWFGRWRGYALFPTGDSVYDPGCLDAIGAHIREMMSEHRARAAMARGDRDNP